MIAKTLAIALVCATPVVASLPAYAQDRVQPLPPATHVAMSGLDRCPFYPSPAVCKVWGEGTGQTAHNPAPGNRQMGAQAHAQNHSTTDYM